MEVVNMGVLNSTQRWEAAQLLSASIPEGWPTAEAAMEEIHGRLIPENTLIAAMDGDTVIGIGGILKPKYHGNVTELHPLAVREDYRKKGVGRMIVAALQEEARKKGCIILWLGADDEREPRETSLGDVDLFDELPKRLANFDPGTHQSGFYMKLGFKVVGVLPDANGPGKPDIFMAKRL